MCYISSQHDGMCVSCMHYYFVPLSLFILAYGVKPEQIKSMKYSQIFSQLSISSLPMHAQLHVSLQNLSPHIVIIISTHLHKLLHVSTRSPNVNNIV